MLVITRKVKQSLTIGNARVHILQGYGGRIKLGIEAPREVEVRRDDADDAGQQSQPVPLPQLPPPSQRVAA